jgi:hypothetical protein
VDVVTVLVGTKQAMQMQYADHIETTEVYWYTQGDSKMV